ncbi:hypothetical protein DCAR_0311984 [Daucus carota subsp. sativus]|uniref:Uncharacterized protein n=1 Tax=Daucus carota subsp. sativus TaxID=79200 RepID=A0AAF0WNZ7_DAUCS|nr:hypothetical protein DCAR_0311984 [Daucus carota subsp. sativus]
MKSSKNDSEKVLTKFDLFDERILAMKTEEVKSPPLEEVKYQTLTVKEIQSLRSESSDAPSVNVSREKAEARSLKQEAEKALKQRLTYEDRLVSMDASLKECMQQLRLREKSKKKGFTMLF